MKNDFENIPDALIGGKSTLIKEFSDLALKEGEKENFAVMIEKLLPIELRNTIVWFDNLTKMWRYYFGPPIDNLKTDYIWGGTTNNHPVKNLYASLKVANKYLTKEQFKNYINRINDSSKHIDALFEMRPIINVNRLFKKYFEVSGYGSGNMTIDWRVNLFGFNIVFDVKNRVKSLITHLEEIIPYMNANHNNIIPPAPEPKDLFRSVENKFLERKYYQQLQGVWIQTLIKEKKSRLDEYFHTVLNPKKVHFAIISDWEEDAYILTRNNLIKNILKRIFHIKESERHVTENYL